MYYPTIIAYRLDDKIAGAPVRQRCVRPLNIINKASLTEALAALDNVPRNERSAISLTYHASLLLSVGRVDEAQTDIEQALSSNPATATPMRCQAIIAVVQNDKEQALISATKAVELDQTSPLPGWRFPMRSKPISKSRMRLKASKKRSELDPQNALAWARLAELHMSTGYLDRALEAAQRR